MLQLPIIMSLTTHGDQGAPRVRTVKGMQTTRILESSRVAARPMSRRYLSRRW
jgi:hypothetical protein